MLKLDELSKATPMIYNLTAINNSVDSIVSTRSKTINTAIASTLQACQLSHVLTNVSISTIAIIFRCHISIASAVRSYVIIRWNQFNVVLSGIKYDIGFYFIPNAL